MKLIFGVLVPGVDYIIIDNYVKTKFGFDNLHVSIEGERLFTKSVILENGEGGFMSLESLSMESYKR